MLSETHITGSMSKTMELIEQIQKTARIGAWEWTAGEDTVFCTGEMIHLLERSQIDSGMVPFEEMRKHIFPDDLGKVQKLLEGNAEKEITELDHRWITTTGKILDMRCWYQCYFDEARKLQKICATCQNISMIKDEHERVNDMLQQAEETASLGSWKYNLVTKHVYYSDSLFHLFGYRNKEFENDINRIFEHIVPEDVPKIYETYKKTVADGKRRSADFRLKKKDGPIRYFTSNGKIAYNRRGEKIIVGTVQDITEQHLLNKKLEEQNDFVQKLIDSSVNGVQVLDESKRYILWNKKSEEIYGFANDLVIGKTIKEVFKGRDTSWLESAIDKVLAGERVKISECTAITPGKVHELHLLPIKNAEGKIQVFVLIHDITELKELNNELKHQKEFAEAMIDHSQSAIFVFDKDLRYKAWNKKSEQFYGKTKEEVIGKTMSETFPDADMSVAEGRLRQTLQGVFFHLPSERSKVLNKYYDSYLVPMKNEQDEVISILCMLNDVTEIINASNTVKEANRLLEQKKDELAERTYFLETLLDASIDDILAFDKNMRLIEINKSALNRYGLAKENALGKTIYELFPGIEGSTQLEALKQALNGTAVMDLKFTSQKGDKFFNSSQIPLRNKKNEIFSVLTIAHDITEIKQAVQKLSDLNNQLEAKNNDLNRINSELASFSYIASHDLQEPLRKIQAFISLIQAKDFKNLSENAQDYFKRIQASANRMQQMIDGLLSFSRTNTTPKNFETIDLNETVKKINTLLQNDITEKNATIEIGQLHHLSVIPHQFEQLLEHLVGNALKFQKPDTTPHIQVSSDIVSGKDIEGEVAQRNKEYCKISIKDNGVGFETENAEKIFQMFHRLHGKSEYPGTGIGLAICRRIAQNHNGFIIAHGEVGKGATFNIFIPLEQEEQ